MMTSRSEILTSPAIERIVSSCSPSELEDLCTMLLARSCHASEPEWLSWPDEAKTSKMLEELDYCLKNIEGERYQWKRLQAIHEEPREVEWKSED